MKYIEKGYEGVGAPPGDGPWGLANASDGSIWYWDKWRGLVQVAANGWSTVHKPPTSAVDSIVPGLRGSVWFVAAMNKLAKMAPDGSAHIFDVASGLDPRSLHVPLDTTIEWHSLLASTPDGAVWLVRSDGNTILRVSDDGHAREYPIAAPEWLAPPLAAGSDGTIWFRTHYVYTLSTYVGYIGKQGDIHSFNVRASLWQLVVDRNGVAWGLASNEGFAQPSEPSTILVAITPNGKVTSYSTPADQAIVQIFIGLHGELWAQTYDFFHREIFARVVIPH